MTYRDESGPLDERHENLRRALDENRAKSSALTEEEAAIHRELASVHARLDSARRAKRRLPVAKMLVASPCDESWAAMTGDERKRFCKSCEKHVHNLSAMTSGEVDAFLLANADGNACVRLYERLDGTVLTADCPVGAKRRRMRALRLSSIGAGAVALFAFTGLAIALATMHKPVVVVSAPPTPQQQQVEIVHVPGPVVTVESVPQGFAKLPRAPEGAGWVLVDGPEGTRVFEGKRLLGVTPLVVTLPAGPHSLRAEGTHFGQKWSEEGRSVEVPSKGTADLTFHGPQVRQHIVGRMPVRDQHRKAEIF